MADTLAEAMAQATAEDAGYDVLTISNDLRTIAVPADFVLGVYQDEDVHRVYFKMPRMYGETDLSKYSTVRINYQNANGEGDYYTVEDKTADEDSITFSWLVGRFAFASAGQVKFSVCIRLVDSAGTVTNEFNTTVVEVPVLEGLETDAALDVAVQDAMIRAENAAERAEKAAGTVGGGGTTYTFTDDTATAANGDVQTVSVTKVAGHTVGTDVPADAVFTDTVYDDTVLSDRVTAIETNKIALPLASKKILIIGDSISTDAYANYKKWVTDLIEDGVFTASKVTNNSYHATGFVRTYDENSKVVYDNFPNRLKAVTDTSYDMVITFGGINDYIGAVTWDKFTAAVDSYFSDLTNRFINSRLVVISPLRTYNIYKNKAGYYQQEYANYIIKVARSYALPVLDLTHGSGFYPFVDTFKNAWTLKPDGYDGHDGVHPSLEYGQKFLAPLIQDFLEHPLSGTYTEPANIPDMSVYYTKKETNAAIAKAIKAAMGDTAFSFDGAGRTGKKLWWGQNMSTSEYYYDFNANTGGFGADATVHNVTDTSVEVNCSTYYGGVMMPFKVTPGKTYTLKCDCPLGLLSWGEVDTLTVPKDTEENHSAFFGTPTKLLNNWGATQTQTFEITPTKQYMYLAFGNSETHGVTWDNITLTEG